jgi:energy-coupling factor transporter transmembrane protein EcfT
VIRNRVYFSGVFIGSVILALFVSLNSKSFLLAFLFYIAIFFILGVSITVFPFVYYNHFAELRVLNKIPKYTPGQIVNIADADTTFNVSVRDEHFDIVAGLEHEKYIDSKVAFVENYIEFYQYSYPYVLSYTPYLRINTKSIIEITQRKKRYSITTPDLPSMIKCNFFEIITDENIYRLIVLQTTTDRFIDAILKSMWP